LSDLPVEDLADLYENAPCGQISLTPDRRIAKLNRTLADWLGRPADQLVARSFNELLSFGGKIAFETHLVPMLRLQGRVDEIALDLLDKAGTKIPVIANAVEKRSEEGEPLLTRLTLFKAIDRRKYEHDLLAAREQAEAAALAQRETAMLREQFIAVLGHDLRNPLAALGSGVKLLEKEPLSDRGHFVVNGMGRSVARATLLIDNVLDFARGRLGEGLILQRDAAEPLTPVLEQVVAEVRSIAPERTILARFAIEEPIDCDRQRIGQLAANLISNAVAHGAAEVPIEVEARSSGDLFILSVANGGDPIPAGAQDKLFQPFFRGGVRPSQQGLGLGLFIVSEIAKAHGGAIDVVSDHDRTAFVFSMAIARA
jgi:sigma-B regulation protein RsbU (phosphoserine phosphatase)